MNVRCSLVVDTAGGIDFEIFDIAPLTAGFIPQLRIAMPASAAFGDPAIVIAASAMNRGVGM